MSQTNQNPAKADAGQNSVCKYIISEYRKDTKRTLYVAAKPGYMRRADGTMARDGLFTGGPEWTDKRANALEFTSYLSAARVKGKCPSAKVHPII